MKGATIPARACLPLTKPTAVAVVSNLLHIGHRPTVGELARVQQAWNDAIRDMGTITQGTATEAERIRAASVAAQREALAIIGGR